MTTIELQVLVPPGSHSCWTYGTEVVQRTTEELPTSRIESQALLYATVSCVFTFFAE